MNDYIRLPRSALTSDLWLNPNYGRLLWYLLAKADENGEIALGASFIAKDLGLGRQVVRTVLRRLEIAGFISLNSTNSATIVKIVGCNGKSLPKGCILVEPMIFNRPTHGDIYKWVCQSGKTMKQGFVYAIEFGQFVKIGCSTSPHNRFLTLNGEYRRSMGLAPERMVITPPCSNYKVLECDAHTEFAPKRVKESEMFEVCFEEVVEFFTTLSYKYSNA